MILFVCFVRKTRKDKNLGVWEREERNQGSVKLNNPSNHPFTRSCILLFFFLHFQETQWACLLTPAEANNTVHAEKNIIFFFQNIRHRSCAREGRTGEEWKKKMYSLTVLCSCLFEGELDQDTILILLSLFCSYFCPPRFWLTANNKFQLAEQIAKGVKLYLFFLHHQSFRAFEQPGTRNISSDQL